MGGLVQPDSPLKHSLEQGQSRGLVDVHARRSLSDLENALLFVEKFKSSADPQQTVLPVAKVLESGFIKEEVGLRIMELQIHTGGLRDSKGKMLSLEQAEDKRLLTPRILHKLQPRLQHRELIDPNTAEKLNLNELQQRCVYDDDSGLLLFPVKQQPGGTVCVRTGRKVGIFRAVQEGLIDRKVTVRLLEAQLFAGGIADPRSGHRMTIDEAVRHGLMDQDLACTMFARQLQNGGIIDPFTGERLDLEDSIHRDLLSPRLALLVLESLWAFMGLLWPESGDLLPIAEALQQGMISGELARNILAKRHVVGGLYNPEALQVIPLDSASEDTLDPRVTSFLKNTHIPDVLLNVNVSGTPRLNRSSWDSSTSSPTPSSPLSLSSSPDLLWDDKQTHSLDPRDQTRHKLLFHLVTHSYVDAHSGQRLVLLDPELVDLVTATEGFPEHTVDRSLTDKGDANQQGEVEEEPSTGGTPDRDSEMYDRPLQSELAFTAVDKSSVTEVKAQNKEGSELGSLLALPEGSGVEPIKSEEHYQKRSFKETTPVDQSTDHVRFSKSEDTDLEKQPIKKTKRNKAKKQFHDFEATSEKEEEVPEMARLVQELRQGGLMTEEGEKLLPDEAVAQGVLPAHTAVKLMAQAGLFGGFLDASTSESLSVEEVIQEDVVDEELMWQVLQSDRSLAGIVDVEKRQICGVKEAVEEGLIDPNTAARLLEAQVVSGGIVDLQRDKKVSVSQAADLGLIEDGQREELAALEKAFAGSDVDPSAAMTKASLQLQMEGLIDPQTKSPLSLENAIQKGLIKSEEAYQVLARQVAEGGIIHHPSGLRLSVMDAVDRGLVDRSVAPGLEELEWVYKGDVSPTSHPEAVVLQASTGAVLDPESGSKLTLTEAVSKGLLDENFAREVMASPAVTQGVLDPKTVCVVPYSTLVNRGKIDLETGRRFLEVEPFRGVQNEETGASCTLSEAVESQKVDPVPALRLLQSQADTGGIIDIKTGERLSLSEASHRGLIDDEMVKEVAMNQILKGGLVDPSTNQRVSRLSHAVSLGLISEDVASVIQETVSPAEPDEQDTSPSPVASSIYSPVMSLTVSSTDSPANWSDVSTEMSSRSPLSKTDRGESRDEGETSDKSEPDVEEETQAPVGGSRRIEPDLSMDLLCSFAANVEKRIQLAIEEIEPQDDAKGFENLPEQKTEEKLQMEEAAASMLDVEPKTVMRKGFGASDESVPVSSHVSEPEDLTGPAAAGIITEVDEESKDSTELPQKDEEDGVKLIQTNDGFNGKVEVAERERPVEVKGHPETELSAEPTRPPSKQTESKSKKKKKSKQKAKNKEAENEAMKEPSLIGRDIGQNKIQKTAEDVVTDKNALKNKVEEFQNVDQSLEKLGPDSTPAVSTGHMAEPEGDVVETLTFKDAEKVETAEEEVVLLQIEKESQKSKKPPKSILPEEEKAALLLKAKESILKKVYEKGVSEKQTAEDLQALRKEVEKKKKDAQGLAEVTEKDLQAEDDGDEGEKKEEKSLEKIAVSVAVDELNVEEESVIEGKDDKRLEVPSVEKVEIIPAEKGQKQEGGETEFGPEEIQQNKKEKKSKKSKSPRPESDAVKSKTKESHIYDSSEQQQRVNDQLISDVIVASEESNQQSPPLDESQEPGSHQRRQEEQAEFTGREDLLLPGITSEAASNKIPAFTPVLQQTPPPTKIKPGRGKKKGLRVPEGKKIKHPDSGFMEQQASEPKSPEASPPDDGSISVVDKSSGSETSTDPDQAKESNCEIEKPVESVEVTSGGKVESLKTLGIKPITQHRAPGRQQVRTTGKGKKKKDHQTSERESNKTSEPLCLEQQVPSSQTLELSGSVTEDVVEKFLINEGRAEAGQTSLNLELTEDRVGAVDVVALERQEPTSETTTEFESDETTPGIEPPTQPSPEVKTSVKKKKKKSLLPSKHVQHQEEERTPLSTGSPSLTWDKAEETLTSTTTVVKDPTNEDQEERSEVWSADGEEPPSDESNWTVPEKSYQPGEGETTKTPASQNVEDKDPSPESPGLEALPSEDVQTPDRTKEIRAVPDEGDETCQQSLLDVQSGRQEELSGSKRTEAPTSTADLQHRVQPLAPGTQTIKQTRIKKEDLQTSEGQNLQEPSLPGSAEAEAESPEAPRSVTAAKNWAPGKEDVREGQEKMSDGDVTKSVTSKVRSEIIYDSFLFF